MDEKKNDFLEGILQGERGRKSVRVGLKQATEYSSDILYLDNRTPYDDDDEIIKKIINKWAFRRLLY